MVFFRGGPGRRIRGLRAGNTDAIGLRPVHTEVDSRGLLPDPLMIIGPRHSSGAHELERHWSGAVR